MSHHELVGTVQGIVPVTAIGVEGDGAEVFFVGLVDGNRVGLRTFLLPPKPDVVSPLMIDGDSASTVTRDISAGVARVAEGYGIAGRSGPFMGVSLGSPPSRRSRAVRREADSLTNRHLLLPAYIQRRDRVSSSLIIGCFDSFFVLVDRSRAAFNHLSRRLLSRSLNRLRLDLHRQLVGHLIRSDLALAVGVGGQLGLDAVDDRLDLIDLPALGGLGGELQFFVCGNVDRVGVVVNLVPILGKGDGGAVRQIQLDGSQLVLLDRRRRLGTGIRRRLGLGAQDRVGRGIRGGGFGCRLGRRLDGLDHGLFGCLRVVGRRGLIRRSRRLIGHGGVCRLRSGGLHAGVVHRRGDILARLLVGQRAACECRRAHHLRGEQDRQDDRRRLDAEIPPSSQDSTVGLHKTPPTFSAAISRGSSSPDRAAPCVPTWEPNFHSGIPARDVRSSAIRRRTPTRRVKIIASIFTTNTHPGFSAKNELGRQRNECIPDRCYYLTFRNERGVSGHQCGNRAAAPRNECRRRGIDIPANGTSTSPLTGFRYFH